MLDILFSSTMSIKSNEPGLSATLFSALGTGHPALFNPLIFSLF